MFKRSHYEDVLLVRVPFPKVVWSKRHDGINAFERLLKARGVMILQFFLRMSPGRTAAAGSPAA